MKALEYYDSNGVFHAKSVDSRDGFVCRCYNNNYIDKNVPNFSSIVIDFMK